jgi:carbamoyl-phosphate synthase large subunit
VCKFTDDCLARGIKRRKTFGLPSAVRLNLSVLDSTVLIPSGAGAPGFAGILRCLRADASLRILAGDADPLAYGRTLADGFFLMPSSADAAYADRVLQLASEHKAGFVLPITTRELLPLAEAAPRFDAAGIRLILSPAEVLRVANDKGFTYDAMAAAGLTVPSYKRVSNRAELMESILAGTATSRRIFKPASGNGSRGFGIVLARNEPQQRNILADKPGQPYYRFEELPFLLPEYFDTDMLVCEYLPGPEYSVDLLANRGNIHYALVRSREKMIGGISVRGRFEAHPGIIEQTGKICALLGLHGPAGMQFKLRADGTPVLLEVNPRLQGTVSSCLGAGINLPLDALRLFQGKAPEGKQANVHWGAHFVRYWNESFTLADESLSDTHKNE